MKTSELTGAALDWAVVIALGYEIDEHKCAVKDGVAEFNLDCFSPSEVWSQGGPIIEREGISVIKLESGYGVDSKGFTTSKRILVFGAVIGDYFECGFDRNSYGESFDEIYYIGTETVTTGLTPLIAAMRCFVASRLGDEVNVPEELT